MIHRARRAAKEAKDAPAQPALLEKAKVDIKKFVKIGRPGYKGILLITLAQVDYFLHCNDFYNLKKLDENLKNLQKKTWISSQY